VVGAALYGLAVLLWTRRALDVARPGGRGFVWALFLALGAYALTDNILIMPAGMIPFFYLAVMRTRSRRRAARRRARSGFAAEPAAAR
jgi:hypothetical protein